MKKIILVALLSFIITTNIFAHCGQSHIYLASAEQYSFDEYKYRNVVIKLKAGNTVEELAGYLYDVVRKQVTVYEEFYDIDNLIISRDKTVQVEKVVTKTFLILRVEKREYVIDSEDILFIGVTKW